MSLVNFDDFNKLSNFFYRSIGIQPYDKPGCNKSYSLLGSAVFYIGLLTTNLMVLGEILFIAMALKNGNNFVEATMTLAYIGFVSVGEFKMISVWWKRDALTRFMGELERLFPRTPEQQQLYQLPHYLHQSMRVMSSFAMLYMVLIWTYNLFILGQYFIYDRWLHLREVELTLPYFVVMPWDWHGHWTYYMLYAAQAWAGYMTAAGQISCDLLLCATATQVIMHYDHIARSIMEYEPSPKLKDSRQVLEQAAAENMNFLTNTIKYHQHILRLSDMMNDVFGVPLLINFMASSFVICFVGFQLTIGIDPDGVFKLILFLISSAAQVYLICHYGQLLIDASISISDAVYSHNWLHNDARYRKMLNFMIARTQKPALLKATKFLSVSLSTMTEIMQLSYKFFALLRTMYSE